MKIDGVKTFTFTSPYDEYAARIGQEAQVIGVVDPTTYDFDEVGLLYRIRFGDGSEIDAWPEEIDPSLIDPPLPVRG